MCELRLKVNSAPVILTSTITPRAASVALLISCWGGGRYAALLPWTPSSTCCTSPHHQFLEHPMVTAFTSSLESHVASHILTHLPHPQTLGFTTFLEPSSLEYHNLLHLSSPQSLGVTNSLLPHQSCCMNVVRRLPPSLEPHPPTCAPSIHVPPCVEVWRP